MTEAAQDMPAAPKGDAETAVGQEPPSPRASRKPPATSRLLDRLSGLFRPKNGSSLRDDLTDALAESHGHGAFSAEERAMLHNILRLREVRVEDVMVPRADIDAVDLSTTLAELLAQFRESGHSRMPVYNETLDDPRGMVHIRDLVAHITKRSRRARGKGKTDPGAKKFDMSNVELDSPIGDLNIMRPVLFVPPSMLAADLMGRMKAARIQMALVIDEYGGTDGLVSLEDIVEMVVGDIEDEHDDDEAMVSEGPDSSWIVDARAEIDDVAEAIGSDFAAGEHGEDVDSIGGVIFSALGRVPVRGEVIQAVPGFEIHVMDADPRRVKKVRVVRARRRPLRPGE